MLRLKKNWFTFVMTWIALFCNHVWSQTAPSMYTLEVHVLQSFYPKKQALQNIRVDLTNKNKEVICSGTTDSLGTAFFDNDCMKNLNDTIIIKFYRGDEYLHWDDREFVNSLLNEGSRRSCDFILEIVLTHSCRSFHEPFHAQCEVQNADVFLNFETFELELFLKEHPSICILVSQTKHPDETDSLASERMKNFELYLKNAGLDMNRLTFSYDFYTIPTEILGNHAQPKIEFSIVNFDCD